ncbi:hypothetical protein BDP27DRAFT_1164585, partial [Rhodocollybia butyracea]
RGSYIWGRSVHNVRIERLWRDVTQGFGTKWYNFFYDLEAEWGLQPDLDAHIWLLHYIFLPAINDDVLDWAEAWNHHTMTFDGEERQRSPRDMYFFGILQEDASGLLEHLEEEIEDLVHYGVDWHDMANPELLNHHNQYNTNDLDN